MNINELKSVMTSDTFKLRLVRPNTYQLIAPIFHEDGDMVNIYLEERDNNVIITDHGMSLMRLSYLFDVDTDNKKKVLNDIILSRNAEFCNGCIESIIPSSDWFPYIMNYAQLVSEVCNMEILSRDFVTNAFYDYLKEIVYNLHVSAQCIEDYQPSGFPQISIDYAFISQNVKRPIYLFGVKDTSKAQQTIISCLQMEVKNAHSKTIAVFDDIDSLVKKTRINILNTVGKTFDLDGFKDKGRQYIENELGAA